MTEAPPENSDPDQKAADLSGLQITENDPRFGSHEMITCSACSRSNPPNRTACLYCGEPFEANFLRTDIARISYKRPEPWEDGFSLVFAGNEEPTTEVLDSAAKLLEMDTETVKDLLDLQVPIPLIYLKLLPDAGLLASRLSQIGFDCAVVGDDLLLSKVPPTRVRSIKFEDNAAVLEDFNTGRVTAVRFDERVLFVIGSVIKMSTETSGKISKKNLKNIEESQSVSDEAIIDIYPQSDVYGFRIRSAGFDFSCLGEKMQRFVGANMGELTDMFRSRFLSGVLNDSYSAAASLLSLAWPLTETKQASNVSRGPLGGIYKQTVTLLDNTDQFTKFSRLQRHFV